MTVWTALLIVHGLLAVALLGAITHQAVSVWMPARRPAGSFVARFRSVPGASYANAIVVLYLLTFLLGGIIYPEFRVEARVVVEQMGAWSTMGAFELKEHFAAIGLGLLPGYWYYWRQPHAPADVRIRASVTAMVAFIVWWNFLVGHIINNVRGVGT
jgi:hypothetical protein